MSWMADMPDDYLEEEEQRGIMQARKNFGVKVATKEQVRRESEQGLPCQKRPADMLLMQRKPVYNPISSQDPEQRPSTVHLSTVPNPNPQHSI